MFSHFSIEIKGTLHLSIQNQKFITYRINEGRQVKFPYIPF